MTPPAKLHRLNGFDASLVMADALAKVRGRCGTSLGPARLARELLTQLERSEFYLGTEDRDTEARGGTR